MERKKTPDMKELLTGTPSKPSKVDLLSKPSKPEYKRATYIVKQEYIEKIKSLAYWERKEITQVINEVLEEGLKDREVID